MNEMSEGKINFSKSNVKIINDDALVVKTSQIKNQIKTIKKQVQINRKILCQYLKFVDFIIHDLHGVEIH